MIKKAIGLGLLTAMLLVGSKAQAAGWYLLAPPVYVGQNVVHRNYSFRFWEQVATYDTANACNQWLDWWQKVSADRRTYEAGRRELARQGHWAMSFETFRTRFEGALCVATDDPRMSLVSPNDPDASQYAQQPPQGEADTIPPPPSEGSL